MSTHPISRLDNNHLNMNIINNKNNQSINNANNIITSPGDKIPIIINGGINTIKPAGKILNVKNNPKNNILKSDYPLIPIDVNLSPSNSIESPNSDKYRKETPPAPNKSPSPDIKKNFYTLPLVDKNLQPKTLRSPPRGGSKISTQIPISTPTPNITSPVFNVSSDKKELENIKIIPQIIENNTLPQVPLIKLQPIGSIRGSSPSRNIIEKNNLLQQQAPLQQQNQQYQRGWMEPMSNVVPQRPQRPNYSMMSDEESQTMRTQFSTKFSILRSSFPTWNVVFPIESSTLDHIHDVYESYVKQIIVSLNCNQWKVYLILMFFAIEVFVIKALGIDIKGYAISQIKIMNRYDQLLVELGEKYYIQGPSNWPTEIKIIIMASVNAIIFVVVKYLAKYIGGDAAAAPIHAAINHFLGDSMNSSPGVDEFGIPVVPGTQNAAPNANDLGSTLTGLMSGNNNNGFDLQGLMTGFSSLLNNNGTPQGPTAPPTRRPNFTD